MKSFRINISIFSILIIVASFFIISCNDYIKTQKMLDRADAIIDTDPVKAMQLLDSINICDLSEEEIYARYGLLKFIALTKKGEMPVSDSLLAPAMIYYIPQPQPSREKMLTQFFKAAYLSINGKPGSAVKYYADAIKTGDSISENLYSGLALSNTGVIYGKDNLGKEEMHFTKKGLDRLLLAGDTVKIIHGYEQYGVACLHNSRYEEAISAVREALKFAYAINDTMRVYSIKLILAESLSYVNEYSEALKEYSDVLDSYPELFSLNDYMHMSLNLIQQNRFREAQEYIDAIHGNIENRTDMLRWFTLRSNLYKASGNHIEGIIMTDSIIACANEIMENILTRSVLHEERDEYEKETIYLKQISEHKDRIITLYIICGFAICSLLTIFFSFIFKRMKRRTAIQSKKILLTTQRLLEARANLEEKINQHRKEKSELQDTINKTSDLLSESNARLREKELQMESLPSSVLNAYRAYYSVASRILTTESKLADKRSKLLLEKQCAILIEEFSSSSALSNMESDLNTILDSIIFKINQEFSLSPRDKNILVLSLCGFTYKAVACILNEKPATISSAKSRLFHKILEADSPDHTLYHRYLSPRTH